MALSMGLLGGAAFLEPAGSFDLLETQVLTSNTTSVSFSSLNTLAADYQHLQIRGAIRSTQAGTLTHGLVDFNGSALTNRHELRGNGSSVISEAGLVSNKASFFLMPGNNATANSFGGFVMDVLDFASTTKNKTYKAIGGHASSANIIQLTSGFQNSTSAITSITMFARDNQFITGSRFSLYGIKAD